MRIDALHRHLPLVLTLAITAWVSACSGAPDAPGLPRPDVDWAVIAAAEQGELQISWREDVQPVLEKRCIVCHGCYDAPCQLKLSAYEGLARGANPQKVYDGARITAAEPTRLFIDADTPAEWRGKGFHDVLGRENERVDLSTEERLRESVLYRMLRLKQLNPQPRAGIVSERVTLGLDREQACTTADNFDKFARENPLWGMPYGLPNLADAEYDTLVGWLAAGAEPPAPREQPDDERTEVAAWERFLNGASLREQLVARYLYEHLFLGHLYLIDGRRSFYRLVRSTTPPGEAIREIPTTRPFDDPGTGRFWYRLRPYDASIVAKAHVVYPLTAAKRERYRELFLSAEYPVDTLPGYEMPDTANPFKTFAALPPDARYRFMLDDARFFIQGFIKGPVCRGQVALNVIEDQFWVFFADPDYTGAEDRNEILNEVADYLRMPARTQSFNLVETYGKFWKEQKTYLAAKTAFIAERIPEEGEAMLANVWDGDGRNPNAALTVFRNFDSAAVEFGLLGNYPETAWIIDFPLFERIHYLLVAGFDVYGNVGHQLNSRLFMDFLRMEGEDNFLLFLPADQRKSVRDQWYQGIREDRRKYFAEPMEWLQIQSPIRYATTDPQRELFDLLVQRVNPVLAAPDDLNRCPDLDCDVAGMPADVRDAERLLRRLARLKGERLGRFSDVVFMRVTFGGDRSRDRVYTLILNKSYTNLSSLLEDGQTQGRDMSKDSLTVLRGFSGSYPNAFVEVPANRLDDFVRELETYQTDEDLLKFAARYGISRTNPDFWAQSDWFHARYAEDEPLEWGVFDLNRYSNF